MIISTYKCKGLYFAVGISKSDGRILKSSLPRSKKQDAIDEASDFPFEISSRYEKIAKDVCKAYYGKQIKFNVSIYNKTPFETEVLLKVMEVPYGKVTTYKNLAESLGTKAYRAIGTVLNKNPLPIVIPCHRVIKSDLSLGGYRGGIRMKKEMLEKEGVPVVGNMIHPVYIHSFK